MKFNFKLARRVMLVAFICNFAWACVIYFFSGVLGKVGICIFLFTLPPLIYGTSAGIRIKRAKEYRKLGRGIVDSEIRCNRCLREIKLKENVYCRNKYVVTQKEKDFIISLATDFKTSILCEECYFEED